MASPAPARPRIFLLYHFMHPDAVISAGIFHELGKYLHTQGWEVTAFPAEWGFRNSKEKFPGRENIEGVEYRRVSRFALSQHTTFGRLVNCSCMIAHWSRLGMWVPYPEVVLIGTDPAFGVMSALGIKTFSPKTRVAHWCFDLYPEAPIAQGMIQDNSGLSRGFKALMSRAYQTCDALVDIGPCMREKLDEYSSPAKRLTLTPWAQVESTAALPINTTERRAMFGNTNLGLLYSGSLGLAHTFSEFLTLASILKEDAVKFAFATSGPRSTALKEAIQKGAPANTLELIDATQLDARLAAADIHLVSLHPDWEGVVVPSKFFASLAIGRPVLFSGPSGSSIARWIREHRVGWVLDSDNPTRTAAEIRAYSTSVSARETMNQHCFSIYQSYFRKELILQRWETTLRALLPQ